LAELAVAAGDQGVQLADDRVLRVRPLRAAARRCTKDENFTICSFFLDSSKSVVFTSPLNRGCADRRGDRAVPLAGHAWPGPLLPSPRQ
jgi:hypothetical protein